jgi:hypothetical protein
MLLDFLYRFQGLSFKGGLYRVVDAARYGFANRFLSNAFPPFAKRVTPFAYDWLGRIFALGSTQGKGKSLVLLFEPGSGEALEIPCTIDSFHDRELLEFGDDLLSMKYYSQWLAAGGKAPGLDECVGYGRPLFLGGQDSIENLEISDLDVYWSITAQLIDQLRGAPPGTRIRKISITD